MYNLSEYTVIQVPFAHLNTFTPTHTHTCTHMCTHTRTHAHTHTHTHMYTHNHAHGTTQTQKSNEIVPHGQRHHSDTKERGRKNSYSIQPSNTSLSSGTGLLHVYVVVVIHKYNETQILACIPIWQQTLLIYTLSSSSVVQRAPFSKNISSV